MNKKHKQRTWTKYKNMNMNNEDEQEIWIKNMNKIQEYEYKHEDEHNTWTKNMNKIHEYEDQQEIQISNAMASLSSKSLCEETFVQTYIRKTKIIDHPVRTKLARNGFLT